MSITAEQCVVALSEALRERPDDSASGEAVAWFGEVMGIISAFSESEALPFSTLLGRISHADDMFGPRSLSASLRESARREFMARAQALLKRLRLETNQFETRHFETGQRYDYFEEIRTLISGATSDVLFVDRYIDAIFVRRYMPQIPTSVTARLLTSAGSAVGTREALVLYLDEHDCNVELRSFPNGAIHDRHLIIDRTDLYQSGASFKDGARLSPTSINQIVDTAPVIIAALERRWEEGTVLALD